MSKPMTHLEAFMSDNAKRGREWVDSDGYKYRRFANLLETLDFEFDMWMRRDVQVAAEEGLVTWADEPKTLTPQEALRALADGKCIGDGANVYKMSDGESIKRWQPSTKNWCIDCPLLWHAFHIIPDPSQPAEPVTYAEAMSNAIDMPSYAKAEPQVEYPLSSCSCMGDASCPCRRANE